MNDIFLFAIFVVHIVFAPLLLIGLIRKSKARLQGRVGAPLLQPFFDLAKLLRKSETISATTFWAFDAAPIVSLAAIVTVALMTPWLGFASPIGGDIFLVAYLLVFAKFVTALSALDSGSSFGAIGASRETAISLFTEPAMIAALGALALHAHSTHLPTLFGVFRPTVDSAAIVVLAATALWMASMADLSRMPFDDPTTHLELTMVHEAQILENSGRNLAIVQFTTALRSIVLIGLTARVATLLIAPLSGVATYIAVVTLIIFATGVIAVSETTLVRLRWLRLPNLLSFAVGAGLVACLIAALKG